MNVVWSTILYNEAKSVKKTVESLNTIVDAGVIGIDSKTNDNTIGIIKKAAKFPVSFVEFEFNNNFSRARNTVLDKVKKNYGDCWVFVLDGDEVLTDKAQGWFIHTLKLNKHLDAIITIQKGVSIDEQAEISAPTLRLFRSAFRYKYRVHEAVDILNSARIGYAPECIAVNNKHAEDRVSKGKIDRISLLLQDIQDYPNDSIQKYNLAMEYMAEKMFEEGKRWIEKALTQGISENIAYHAQLKLARCYRALNKKGEEEATLLQLYNKYPDKIEHLVHLAVILIDRKEYFNALNLLFCAASRQYEETAEMKTVQYHTWAPWYLINQICITIGWRQGYDESKSIIQNKYPDVLYKIPEITWSE